MVIRVKLPNGQYGRFPDGTSHQEIEKVLQKQFPPTDSQGESEVASTPFNEKQKSLPKDSDDDEEIELPEATGLSGIGVDLLSAALNAKDFVGDIPDKIESLGANILEHPIKGRIRPLGQLAAETTDIGKGIINAPYNLNQYLARKHLLPHVLGKLGKELIPHLPEDTGVEKALGLQADKDKGDDLIRAIPAIFGTQKLLATGVNKIKGAVKAPSKQRAFQRALEERINEAAKTTAMSQEELKGLKESLRRDYSAIHNEKLAEQSPIGQEEAINVKKGKLEKLQPATEIPERKVGEIPAEPDTKAIIDKKKAALEKAQKDATDTLGTLDNPRLKGGAKVKAAIEDVKTKATDLYKAARTHYVDKKVKVDNSKEIKAIGKELNDLAANEGVFEGTISEREALKSKIDSLQEETVKASDLFDLQRTLEQQAENSRNKQYASGKGTTDLERKRYGEIADRLDKQAEVISKRLESVGGKEVQSMIKDANKGWKTFKDLEKRNPVGRAALKGELPTRSMIEIAKAHPANDFLSALVESDPELKKHMLAAYAGESNVNKLLKPTTLTKKYIESLPEVEEHVNALKDALRGVKEGEIKASKVKKEYDDLVISMKNAAKEQKIRQDAIKESDQLKKQIKFHEDAIPKLKSKIESVEKNSAEHKRLQKELDEHKKFIQDKGGRLKELGAFFLKVKGMNMLRL